MKAVALMFTMMLGLLNSANLYAQSDSDRDGVPDAKDACPQTPAGKSVDARGCVVVGQDVACLLRLDDERQLGDCQRGEPVMVHFAFASDRVDIAQWPQLALIKAYLLSANDNLCLIGHTDDIGSDEFNLTLSRQRALNVKQVLVQDYGFDPQRFTVIGMGASEPIKDNGSKAERALNRRVEFIVETR